MKLRLREVARATAAIAAILIGFGWANAVTAAPAGLSQDQLDQTRRVSAAFGRCIVKGAAGEASQFVLSPTVRRKGITQGSSLIDPDCLKAGPGGTDVEMLSSTALYFAYEFADALVRARLANFGDDLKSVPLTAAENSPIVSIAAHRTPNESAAQFAKEQTLAAGMTSNSMIDLFGYCVVRADSKDSHALLMTDVTTSAERTEFAALQPAMDGCLTEGQQINSDLTSIRGTIALAYYRLAVAANPQLAPASKGKH